MVSFFKWLFPKPSNDLKIVFVSLFLSWAVLSYGKSYVDKRDNYIKEELQKKENDTKKAIIDEATKIIIVLNHLKTSLKEVKNQVKDTQNKVWELSRDINRRN